MQTSRFTCLFFLFFCCVAGAAAQPIITDTFLRKDGIHPVPPFEPWQTATLFRQKKGKGGSQPILPADACERVKQYTAFATKKTEPLRFFKVLTQLEAHDSSTYFESIGDIPPAYQWFFKGLYHVEENSFDAAMPLFERVQGAGDSLLTKEAPFWKDLAAKMKTEQFQHNIVLSAYALGEELRPDSVRLMRLLEQITLPQYLVHKYISLFNFHYRKNHYREAGAAYDSALAHSGNSKLHASLTKNRVPMQEILGGKETFVATMRKGLYHYEIDYLYDHLEVWGRDTLTDRELAEDAGFKLFGPATNKTDTVFTRRLTDTAIEGLLSKFEVLSFIRTPLDKAGRRFVIVQLDFDHEDTWNKYASFLEKFKSKPVQQSVLYNKGRVGEGNEYMLTKHFIAALYRLDDPVLKYRLGLYLLEDAEGNVFAVDTLF